jgi:CRP-like cAMP-binding protein
MALDFFKAAGKAEKFAPGATVFAENEKSNRLLLQRDKMYLLLNGEVSLSAHGKAIGTVKPGEIFGEMAPITHTPRSATAKAAAPSSVIALDDRQFQDGLTQKPEFALMMMSMMIGRLRDTLARLGESGKLSGDESLRESRVFDKKMLGELQQALEDPPVYFDRNKVIVQEGQAGIMMYVVLEGRVSVSIQGKVVERVGPGGVFGEMALVDQAPRAANVAAELDSALLGIHRNTFLRLVRASPAFGVSLLAAIAERLRFADSQFR